MVLLLMVVVVVVLVVMGLHRRLRMLWPRAGLEATKRSLGIRRFENTVRLCARRCDELMIGVSEFCFSKDIS